ncbi:MAG: glycoside hydrolase family 15 protein [Actinomycetota bacterium]|nr:glycoside hydrolase family 15 protein [Actinomycetota bacterium]
MKVRGRPGGSKTGYQPLENYGIIGDLHTVALVGLDGSIDYMCFPDFDSPTIFGALLDDEKGGRFKIHPQKECPRQKQLYIPDTNVLLTRFLSQEGVGEITDFMPVEEMRHTHILIRRVKVVRGPMEFTLLCAPRFDYARGKHHIEMEGDDVLFVPEGDAGRPLRLRSQVPLTIEGDDVVANFTLNSNEAVNFILETEEAGAQSPTAEENFVRRSHAHTVSYWREWVSKNSYEGRWQDMVSRSALALKLLTSARYGSIAAAATFGLPEEIGGERNWDYRFTWIRDASFSIASLIRLGLRDEAEGFVEWVKKRFDEAENHGELQIMYGIDGRKDLKEEILEHFTGYRDSSPVRIGNGAFDQLQLDIYGELLYVMDLYDEHVQHVSYDMWRHLEAATDWVCRHWGEDDEGIWEVRGGRREFLYSRLTDWVAMDRAIRIAQRRSLPAPMNRWVDVRDEIHREIYQGFWDEERRAFVQYKGAKVLDASALIMPLVGFIAPRDPRWLSTLKAIEGELVDDSLVYRYLPEAAAEDGLEGAEGTFCMCSFWFIECLARAGEVDKARLYFEKMHGYANHLGLYAEEMDRTGRFLGNFPQAFTHLALINTAVYLNEALEKRRRL